MFIVIRKDKHKHMKNLQKFSLRWIIYLLGMIIQALGITMNTKTCLGVSPIISAAYSISEIFHFNLGDMTMALYSTFVAMEIVIHLWICHSTKMEFKSLFIKDLLQLPASLFITRVINLFSVMIPTFTESHVGYFWGSMVGRLILLICSVVFTGIGACLSLEMRIVPNPGDGIVQALADASKVRIGTVKNCFDCSNIVIASCIGIFFAGRIVGIGVGTIIAMIGVGRVIAVVNKVFGSKMTEIQQARIG